MWTADCLPAYYQLICRFLLQGKTTDIDVLSNRKLSSLLMHLKKNEKIVYQLLFSLKYYSAVCCFKLSLSLQQQTEVVFRQE